MLQSPQDFEGIFVRIVQLFACCLSSLTHVRGRGRVSLSDRVPGSCLSIDQHGLAALARFANDGRFIDSAGALRLSFLERLISCVVGFRKNLVAGLKDLLSLFQVNWHRESHLVDDVQHALAVHDQVAANRQSPGLNDQFFQAIDEIEDLHWWLQSLFCETELFTQGRPHVRGYKVGNIVS